MTAGAGDGEYAHCDDGASGNGDGNDRGEDIHGDDGNCAMHMKNEKLWHETKNRGVPPVLCWP